MDNNIIDLYEKARKAHKECDNDNAYKYYKEIQAIDENSWEANFEITYFEAMSAPEKNLWASSMAVLNIEKKIFNAIKHEIKEEEKILAIDDVCRGLTHIAERFVKTACNKFDRTEINLRDNYISEYVSSLSVAAEIMYLCGDSLSSTFKESQLHNAASAWKKAIEINIMYIKFVSNKIDQMDTIKKYTNKIKKTDDTYKAPSIEVTSHTNRSTGYKIKKFFSRINPKSRNK